MSDLKLTVNGRQQTVRDLEPDVPLLWVLRERLGLLGAKYGCGEGLCGACTVLLDGVAIRSCSIAAQRVAGRKITTIEGLGSDPRLHPLQAAWIELDVAQCGYCQAGQIMSAAALLAANPSPSDEDINRSMSGNLCRCGTYQRIRSAIHLAASRLGAVGETT